MKTPQTTEHKLHRQTGAQWAEWSSVAKRVFNTVYAALSAEGAERLYSHPQAADRSKKHWQTTAWNAAWLAADATDAALRDIAKG